MEQGNFQLLTELEKVTIPLISCPAYWTLHSLKLAPPRPNELEREVTGWWGLQLVVWLGALVPSVSRHRAQWGPGLHTVVLRGWYVLETKGCSSLSLSYLISEMGMGNLGRKAGVMATGSSAAGLYSNCSIKPGSARGSCRLPRVRAQRDGSGNLHPVPSSEWAASILLWRTC